MNFAKYVQKNNMRELAGGLLLLISFPVFAHHPMGGVTPQTLSEGLLSGLGHPIIGVDHLAFLVVAMLLANALKGAARFMVPLVFIGTTVAGTIVHLGGVTIPMSGALVALTVMLVGMLALTRHYPGALAVSVIFAVSGILHGYAYGESIIGAESTPLLAYLAGFAAIQYALIIAGMFVMEKITRKSEAKGILLARISSVMALITGGVFFTLGIV